MNIKSFITTFLKMKKFVSGYDERIMIIRTKEGKNLQKSPDYFRDMPRIGMGGVKDWLSSGLSKMVRTTSIPLTTFPNAA
jgi:hypothetical protein